MEEAAEVRMSRTPAKEVSTSFFMVSGPSRNTTASSGSCHVLFEKDSLIVVHKPVDVSMDEPVGVTKSLPESNAVPASSSTATAQRWTVSSWAYEYMKKRGIYDAAHEELEKRNERKKQLKFVHQLDYATSGVLCLAFTKAMAQQLAHCFEMRTTRKWYLALLTIPDSETAPLQLQVVQKDMLGSDSAATLCTVKPSSREGEHNAKPEEVDAAADASPQGECRHRFRSGITLCNDAERKRLFRSFFLSFAEEAAGLPLRSNSPEAEPSRNTRLQYVEERELESCTTGASGVTASHPFPLCDTCKACVASPEALEQRFSATPRLCLGEGACEMCKFALCFATHTLLQIDLPVGSDETDTTGFRMALYGQNAREATTHLLVLGKGFGIGINSSLSPATKLEAPVLKVLLMPRTGRRHQLRLHTLAVGHPILGDATYCPLNPFSSGAPASSPSASEWPRMCLHAWRLAVPLLLRRNSSAVESSAMPSDRDERTEVNRHGSGTTTAGAERDWIQEKKRMRRERLGLEDPLHNARERNVWTDFITNDPFPQVSREYLMECVASAHIGGHSSAPEEIPCGCHEL